MKEVVKGHQLKVPHTMKTVPLKEMKSIDNFSSRQLYIYCTERTLEEENLANQTKYHCWRNKIGELLAKCMPYLIN